VVVSCEHAGLRPYFKGLEDEIYRVLARIDEPKEVVAYLSALWNTSREWFELAEQFLSRK
jgi:hypothetical protein